MARSIWTDEEKDLIRQNLQNMRRAKGLTGRQLAEKLYMSYGTLVNHEASGRITLENLKLYADFYKFPSYEEFLIPTKEFQIRHCTKHTPYSGDSRDDLYEAVKGLDQFTKNWCLNVTGTEMLKEPIFQCSTCEFSSKKGTCLIKKFADSVKEGSQYPMEVFGAMSR